jgi:hypothetical protein
MARLALPGWLPGLGCWGLLSAPPASARPQACRAHLEVQQQGSSCSCTHRPCERPALGARNRQRVLLASTMGLSGGQLPARPGLIGRARAGCRRAPTELRSRPAGRLGLRALTLGAGRCCEGEGGRSRGRRHHSDGGGLLCSHGAVPLVRAPCLLLPPTHPAPRACCSGPCCSSASSTTSAPSTLLPVMAIKDCRLGTPSCAPSSAAATAPSTATASCSAVAVSPATAAVSAPLVADGAQLVMRAAPASQPDGLVTCKLECAMPSHCYSSCSRLT